MRRVTGIADLDGEVSFQEVDPVWGTSVVTSNQRNDQGAGSIMGDDTELEWGGWTDVLARMTATKTTGDLLLLDPFLI